MIGLAQTASDGGCSCDVRASCGKPAVPLTASREHLARLLYWCGSLRQTANLMPFDLSLDMALDTFMSPCILSHRFEDPTLRRAEPRLGNSIRC